jgi:glycerol kinase
VNPTINRIVIGGGLARFDGFCQRLADLGLPVVRTRQTETTSQGLAWLLSQSQGAATAKAGQTRDDSLFMPMDNPALRQRFRRWQNSLNEALANDD